MQDLLQMLLTVVKVAETEGLWSSASFRLVLGNENVLAELLLRLYEVGKAR